MPTVRSARAKVARILRGDFIRKRLSHEPLQNEGFLETKVVKLFIKDDQSCINIAVKAGEDIGSIAGYSLKGQE